MPEPLLADSVTKLDGAAGRVVVTGSHGGVFAASLAFRSACRAVVFHDAGVGLDAAGIGGLAWLDALGMAAAAVDYRSADIGDARAMLAGGTVSHANAAARAVGVAPGMDCAAAAALLEQAPPATGEAPQIREAREDTPTAGGRRLILVDSASLVLPGDAGQVVVTGSHGAIFGGNPANALKADAALALFNDAGGRATSRLSALEARGVAAATVAASSARIGDAHSTYRDGIVSACNGRAAALGAHVGIRASELVALALGA